MLPYDLNYNRGVHISQMGLSQELTTLVPKLPQPMKPIEITAILSAYPSQILNLANYQLQFGTNSEFLQSSHVSTYVWDAIVAENKF